MKVSWDLTIISIWAILLFVVVLVTDSVVVRGLISLPVLFFPGYAFLRSFGITRESLLEQTVYSIGVSLALCIMGGFLLNTIGGLTPIGWAAWFVIIAGISAFAGRRRPLPWNFVVLRFPIVDRSHMIIIGVAVCVMATSYALAARDAHTSHFTYTDFWMLPAAPGKLIVGIKSEETKPHNYDVEVTLRGQVIANWQSIRLDPGRAWTRVLDLPAISRHSKANAVLYLAPDVIYRKVSTIITPN